MAGIELCENTELTASPTHSSPAFTEYQMTRPTSQCPRAALPNSRVVRGCVARWVFSTPEFASDRRGYQLASSQWGLIALDKLFISFHVTRAKRILEHARDIVTPRVLFAPTLCLAHQIPDNQTIYGCVVQVLPVEWTGKVVKVGMGQAFKHSRPASARTDTCPLR